MKITVALASFRDALTTATQVTPAKPHLAALAGVLLDVRGTTLRCVGSDGDSTLSVAVVGSDASDGNLLIDPRPVTKFLSRVRSTRDAALSLTDAGDLRVKIDGMPEYHFRPMSTSFALPAPLRTPAQKVDWTPLAAALSAVEKAAGKDERVVQLVSHPDGRIALHATDHYRLAKAGWNGGGFGEFAGVLDLGLLRTVSKHRIDEITVSSDRKQLRLSGGAVVLSTRVKAVSFPAVDTVMSNVPSTRVPLSARELTESLDRLEAVCGGEPVQIVLEGDTMTLRADNASIGDATEEVALAAEVAAPFEFGVDPLFLRDALVGHPDDTVTLAWTAPTAPLYLISSGSPEVSAVVMPVRLLAR
jgi:DNA polymerase III sliding clamp (beta) subunit (PCNA family)